MNTSTAENPVQWLFLDLNAFFASCEQQENPALRGRPVIVVQTPTDSAVAIAASYAAKAFGIKTGTLVREARRLCPAVIPVQANHRLYTEYHERILKAVDTCLPVEKVCSIDEMACRLMGTERQVPAARELALKVKRALRDQIGECLTCSIGLAPNVFLGKIGSDLQKPDGLVVITMDKLPDILLGLELQEIYGIGPRMEQRLHRAGILTVAQLWNATPFQLRRVWGGINGLLFHQMLHGVDIQPPSSRFSKSIGHQPPSSRFSKSIGHQHVLEPELRTSKGAHDFAQHLVTKAAERLRRGDYYCRRLGVHLSWIGDLGGFWEETLKELLPDFETPTVALERKENIIEALEGGNSDAKRLATKLAECVADARCNLPMCPVCVRLLRRFFVLSALVSVDELRSAIERRAELPITAFSAVLAGETYPVGELHEIDIPLINKRIQRRHQRAKFPLAFAGLDISLNEDGQAKTPPYWQAQIYGVVVGLPVDAVKTELQRLYPSATSTPRPLRVRKCSDLPEAISYVIKSVYVRRVSYLDDTGRFNTRKLSLKPRQLRELAVCLGQTADLRLAGGNEIATLAPSDASLHGPFLCSA